MLSSKCKYAFRSVLFLAANSSPKQKCGLKEISAKLHIPTPYLGKILQELVVKGIISSTKGPNGGFFLSDLNKNLKLTKVVEKVDGLSVFNSCGLGLEKCSADHPCPIHYEFILSRDSLKSLLDSKSIAELSQEVLNETVFLTP